MMLRLYLKLTATLTLFFALIMGLMLWLGSHQSIHPALRGFVEGCENIPQPCWYGIVPGETTEADVEVLLTQAGYQQVSSQDDPRGYRQIIYGNSQPVPSCAPHIRYNVNNGRAELIQLQCVGVVLGDVTDFFGLPRQMVSFNGAPLRLLFEGDTISVLESGGIGWSSLYGEVRLIDIQAVGRRISISEVPILRWFGIVPAWRYCQLQYSIRECYRPAGG